MGELVKQKIIGLAGVARSGKDTVCKLLCDELHKDGLVGKRYALADELKEDINPFLKEKCGIDIFNCTDEEKEMVRPLLLWYGTDFMRNKTKGRAWIDKLYNRIKQDTTSDYIFITDIRYAADEDGNEVVWLKEELGGKLVYVSQYSITEGESINDNEPSVVFKSYLLPPNKYEKRHNPYLQQMADIHFEWEKTLDELGNPDYKYLSQKIVELYNQIK